MKIISVCIPGTVLITVLHMRPMEYQHFVFRHDPLQWREYRMHPRAGFAYKADEVLEFCFLTWPIVSHTRLGVVHKTNIILTFFFPIWSTVSPPAKKMIRAIEKEDS